MRKGNRKYADLRLVGELANQGIKNVRETVHRAEKDVLEQLEQTYGTRVRQIYWTVGSHDLVTIVEAPDEESVSAMVLALGSQGNLRTTTLRAYDHEEMSRVARRRALFPAPAHFREPRTGEVLRTRLPRTRANRGKKKRQSCYVPALWLSFCLMHQLVKGRAFR